MWEPGGRTTPTDSRSKRLRASRRGGQLLTRARSASNKTGLPSLRSLPDAPRPGRSHRTHRARSAQQLQRLSRGTRWHLGPFIPDTNPLEHVNKEIGRRSDVVGIYPNDQALVRLAGMLLLEQNDEWLVQHRYLRRLPAPTALPARRCRPSWLEQPRQGGHRAQRRLSPNVLPTIPSYTTTRDLTGTTEPKVRVRILSGASYQKPDAMAFWPLFVFCGRQGVQPGNGCGQLFGLMSGREGRCLTDGSGDVRGAAGGASSGRSGNRVPERGGADRVNLAVSPQEARAAISPDERSSLIGGASPALKASVCAARCRTRFSPGAGLRARATCSPSCLGKPRGGSVADLATSGALGSWADTPVLPWSRYSSRSGTVAMVPAQ